MTMTADEGTTTVIEVVSMSGAVLLEGTLERAREFRQSRAERSVRVRIRESTITRRYIDEDE